MSPNQHTNLETYYEFLPSVRAGYRPSRKYGEPLQGRSKFGVELTVEGKEKGGDWTDADTRPQTDIRLYGPGDVSGIDERQVVRVEPEPDTSTMPPNYFPLVEFDRTDLPWLFSPERANPEDDAKVRPWLCLVVVEKTNEAVSIEADGTKPLPALRAPQNELPPLSDAWAWAHVQVTGKLTDAELERVFTGTSDQAVSRLLCPRNLDPNTRYVAAVVPTFEPGRRVGLGKEPFESSDGDPSIDVAWDASKEKPTTVPIYYQWEFATGNEGDFESLARKLEPRQLSDAGVGKRDVDLTDPGPPQIGDANTTFEVGGALMSPGLDQTPFPKTANGTDQEKRLALRRLLNDPDSTVRKQPNDPDSTEKDKSSDLPVVGPPIYGQWYLPDDADWSLTDDGVPTPPDVPEGGSYFDAWIHELNVDPRWRIPAGYGTEVIQENQESLMEAAWKQFGDLELANEQTGRSQLADLAGRNVWERFERTGDHVVGVSDRLRDFEELNREILANGRLRDEGALVDHDVSESVEAEVIGGTGRRTQIGDQQFLDVLQTEGKLGADGVSSQFTSGNGAQKLNKLRLGQSNGPLRGDGAGSLPSDPQTLSRYAQLSSPAYRRLTRSKGTLDRSIETSDTEETYTERLGQSFSLDSEQDLGTRFARVSDRVTDGKSQPSTLSQAGRNDANPAPTAARNRQPTAATTNWRVGPDGSMLSLSDAIDELDGSLATVPKALLAIESVRDHCETARRRLEELDTELDDSTQDDSTQEFSRAVVVAVTERPTVEDHCDAIRQNTFDTLDRQFGKLLSANPDPLSAEFSRDDKQATLQQIEAAHSRLTAAMRYVTDAVKSRSDDPATIREKVDEALSAIGDIETALDDLGTVVDSGMLSGRTEMQMLSSESGAGGMSMHPMASRTSTGPEVDQPRVMQSLLSAQQTQLLEGTTQYPGLLDASSWTKQRATWNIHPAMAERDVELSRILAAPEFDEPMYRWLKELDEQYLLPGVQKVPTDTIGALQTNSEFIESFMCGLNHEMARELQWRRYPTDRRGTFFRQFWKYIGSDQDDITKLHTWGSNSLGTNRAAGITDDRVVLLVRGDLLRAYPNTRIYAVKAVKENKSDGSNDPEWDRVPLLESLREQALDERTGPPKQDQTLGEYTSTQLDQSDWDPKEPVFSGRIDPDITFFGFDLTTAEVEGSTLDENPSPEDLGWFFVLEERVGETRFGYDVAGRGDYDMIPYGIEHGGEDDRSTKTMGQNEYENGAERGWNALSWGHLVDSAESLKRKKYVDITGDNPAGGDDTSPWAVAENEEWNDVNADSWDYEDSAEWGKNSAHMARIAWQLPVRVCIHGDDVLPEMSGGDQQYVIAPDFVEVDDR